MHFPLYKNLLKITVLLALGCFSVSGQSDHAHRFYAEQPHERIADWQIRHQHIDKLISDSDVLSKYKLLFIGDSITHFWEIGVNPWVDGQKCGLSIWKKNFSGINPENHALNIGVTGDRTEHMLFRLLPKDQGGYGYLDSPDLQPEFILILIGINNSWNAEEPVNEGITSGIIAVLEAAHRLKPGATIILQSLLPTNDVKRNNDIVIPVNAMLKDYSKETKYPVFYLDLYSEFIDDEGFQCSEWFYDGLHPNEVGYKQWAASICSLLKTLRT